MTPIARRDLLARRFRPVELVAIDWILAAGLALVCAYAASEAPVPPHQRIDEPLWVSGLVGFVIGAPIAVRRRWPVYAALVTTAGSAAAMTTAIIPNYASSSSSIAVACAMYLVGLAEPFRRALTVVTIGVLATIGALAIPATSIREDLGGIGFNCFMIGAAWLLGRATAARRAHAAQTAEHLAQRAVDDERLRLARDLHDIVAHSMSLIAVKAAVANHVGDASPEEARRALRVIEETSRAALRDIRQTLGVLRDDASYSPAPGLGDIAGLADRAAAAGVRVDLSVSGDDRVPGAVGVSVYRIVQEALTNVVKHAAPATCRVEVAVEPGEVRIEVTDDGRRTGPAGNASGQGLIGMRERVDIYGGQFQAGPQPEGGFAVRARLPFGSAA